MLQIILACALHALIIATSVCSQDIAPPAAAQLPQLVVVVAVDQLAEWTYQEARPFFGADGFARLEREGQRWNNCSFKHAVSQTAPGHATMATGVTPALHGITGNNWHDNKGAKFYCCADAAAKTPLGAKAGENLGPAQLLVPTVAERMRAHFGPACFTACVGWKDRAAILLGGRTHIALWIDAEGNFTTSTAYVPELPPWVRALNSPVPAAALHSGKQWVRCGPDAAYAGLVDDRSFEPVAGGTRTLPRPVGKADAAPDISAVGNSPFALDVVLQGTSAVLAAMPLGRDATPDFLGVAFSPVDAVGHNFDPTSVEVRDVILATDKAVAQLLAMLDARVGLDKCLIIVCADHGITPAPEVLAARGMPGGRGSYGSEAAKIANRTLVAAFGEPPAPHKRFVITGTTGGVLLDEAALLAAKHSSEEAALLAAAALQREAWIELAVARTLCAKDAAAERDPQRKQVLNALVAATHPERSGHVLYALKSGYIESGSLASHGSPHAADCAVPLIVRGGDMPAGSVDAAPVAPTLIAAILARNLGLPPLP